jgi:bifunctional non-homologous end joining protein LigD
VGLEKYLQKRRFAETPEPKGGGAAPSAQPRFVVQEHHARRVHWDLRLEMEGVLRSWAVPKGPSLDPADKRLAVLVEDHPIEYGEFEGIIPAGNYGAGTVMLWDRGTYECLEGDPAEAFRRGKLTLVLHGEKLGGEFHFVRTKRNEGRDWLLFKGKDQFANPGYVPAGTRSVKTGRAIEEIRAEQDARWQSSAPGSPPAPAIAAPSTAPLSSRPAKRSSADPFPQPFRPMLAQSAERPFSREGWLFEIKWDGVRTLGFMQRRGAAQDIALYSRTLRRLNVQFPEIVEALAALSKDSVVLDGEIFAPDERGRPDFARLQQRVHLTTEADVRQQAERVRVFYAVFDCLYLNGRDLRERPLSERRQVLEGLVLPPGMLRSDAILGDGQTLFDAARQHGLEGIIAKRSASPYRPGVRSPDWQKIKVRQRLEAVVGGFTSGKGHRKGTFGALVLGQYDPATGALVHIGQTGGGLKDRDLDLLLKRLDPLVTDVCPFAIPPSTLQPATWVRPEVVVEVEYGEFTPDGMLRAPVFMGIRDDVLPTEVQWQLPALAQRSALDGAGVPSPPNKVVPAQASPDTRARGKAAAPEESDAPAEPRASAGGRGPAKSFPFDEPHGPARPVGGRRSRSPKTSTPRQSSEPSATQVAFSNLEKVFFPELGLTKGDVIAYYRRIAPYILPHLRDRPLTLRRWPNGITGDDFFQKDVDTAPAFVRTERVWSSDGKRNLRLVICNDEPTLLWLAQMGCIEMHAWFSRITPIAGRGKNRPGTMFAGSEEAIERSTLNYPDVVVLDIDPFLFPEGKGPTKRHGEYDPDYTRKGFEAARTAALLLGKALDDIGLRAFLKTSGKTGLHVFIPIVRQYTYGQTHAFAKTMTTWLAGQHREALTTAWSVRDRVGKVFLDYNQNLRGKTLASVYSLRPVPQASVSVPVTWDELKAGFDPLQWTIATVFDRLERVGDLWANILEAAQHIEFRGSSGRA